MRGHNVQPNKVNEKSIITRHDIVKIYFCIILVLSSRPALAHNDAHANGLLAGLLHPVSGADHMLAMLATGLWAATLNPAPRRWLPALFALFMVLGAIAAASGATLAGIETLVAVSVVALGLLTAFSVRLPLWAGGLLLGLFAIAHGQAHNLDMPADVAVLSYFTGLIVATALLQWAGLLAGAHAKRLASRAAGWIMTLAGWWLMIM